MRSFWTTPLSSHFMWEFQLVLTLFFLCRVPSMEPVFYSLSTAVSLGVILVLFLFKKIPQDAFSRLGVFWFLFLFYLLVSPVWSLVPGQSLQSAAFPFVGTSLYLMALSNSEDRKKRLEMWILILAFGAALWGLYQLFWGFDELKFTLSGLSKMDYLAVEKAIFYRRASGPLLTSGSLAALLVLTIPLSVIKTLNASGSKRGLFLLVTLALLIALGTTQSVGAWSSLAVTALIVFLGRGDRKWFWLTMAGGVLAIGGVILLRGYENWGVSSLGMRVLLWKSAWQLFLQHPLFGSGLGSFDEAYQQAGFSLTQGGARYPHNILLQLLCETGLAGTTLFLAAIFSFARRFKVPSRWEGWGVMTGGLAFFLFSFLDLPFQMPELVWIFSVTIGRLELKPEKAPRFPVLGASCVPWVLLVVFLVSGFFHPFRPWNLALLACALWVSMALYQEKLENLPLWVWAGGIFMVGRACLSPSAMGAVWFFELSGFALAFGLLLRGLPDPRRFMKWFCGLGLVWALQVWRFSFQSSDIKDWLIFPNPKQVGIFLLGLLFLQVGVSLDLKTIPSFFQGGTSRIKNWILFLYSGATLICLKAFGAMVGLAVGAVIWVKKQQRIWAVVLAGLFIAVVLFARSMVFQTLDAHSTLWDRVDIWKSAIMVWAKEPLEGVGPGAFAGLYHQVKSPRTSGPSRYLMDAGYTHNEFLELLTAFGLIGFIWGLSLLWKLWPRQKTGSQAALGALGTASCFDFCLHTPLIALQGAGFLTPERKKKETHSWTSAFLAGGVALGLFGSAAYCPALLGQAQRLTAENKLQQAYRCLQSAEKLDAWDIRYSVAKADYLEDLYRQTKDPVWEKLSDEAYDWALDLELADGPSRMDKAERLIRRLTPQSPRGDFEKVKLALQEAEDFMPFNAFIQDDKGKLYAALGQNDAAIACFQKAVELEPNFAEAWFRLGTLLMGKGDTVGAEGAYGKSLQVYEQWKDADRISELEKNLVGLKKEEADWLMRQEFP